MPRVFEVNRPYFSGTLVPSSSQYFRSLSAKNLPLDFVCYCVHSCGRVGSHDQHACLTETSRKFADAAGQAWRKAPPICCCSRSHCSCSTCKMGEVENV